MSQEGRPPGQNYHEFPSGNSQTHYVGLSPQAACSSDATVHASGPQQQWLSGQNSGENFSIVSLFLLLSYFSMQLYIFYKLHFYD